MGWRKFIVYAKTQYGVEFTEAEAKRIRVGFFKKYRSLESWHQRTKEFALKHKYVRSYSGRIRHLPMVDSDDEGTQAEAIRQAINSPVQEFGSSLGVMALGRLNEEIDPEYIMPVGFVHDAIICYVRKEYLDWGLKTVKHYMESNPIEEWFGVTVKTPIISDCGFGENLSKVYELDGFKLSEPYDFTVLADKETGEMPFVIPEQLTPPHGGRLQRSPYTTDADLESEDAKPRKRRVRASARPQEEAPRPRVRRVRSA